MIRTFADRPEFNMDEYLDQMQVVTQEEFDSIEDKPDYAAARKQRQNLYETASPERRAWMDTVGV